MITRLAAALSLLASTAIALPQTAPAAKHRHARHHRHARRHRHRHAQPPAPSTLRRTGVDEGEYYLHPTHPVLDAGLVELDPVNLGMDEHNMTIRDARGRAIATSLVQPGQTTTLQASLTPGRYTLVCSLFNHESLGMRATLTVR